MIIQRTNHKTTINMEKSILWGAVCFDGNNTYSAYQKGYDSISTGKTASEAINNLLVNIYGI